MRETRAQQRMMLKDCHHLFHVGFGIEQADNVGITPQTRFTGQRLKYRRVVRVLEGHRDRTGFHQRIAKFFGVRTGRIQFQLDPRHGKTLYLSVVNKVACWADEPKRFPARKANKLSSSEGTMG